ncbi:hypothetical protein [Phaeobacter sp. HF9A]|uniref:hypothetical protein n=1 Tax=Phaeobacter sp. HF9A TaxID=2721561 RepID=UPI00142FBB1A|nr:hypothetical protein [Phaeobacter sp. HF9A]NIZ15464.1 hypothetical protein [Phaeobacter sp. HF9A]
MSDAAGQAWATEFFRLKGWTLPGADVAETQAALSNHLERWLASDKASSRSPDEAELIEQCEEALGKNDVALAATILARLDPPSLGPIEAGDWKGLAAYWQETRSTIEGGARAVHAAAISSDQALEPQLAPLLDIARLFGAGLGNALEQSARDDDPKAKDEARRILAQYKSHLIGNPFLKHLDANPYLPMALSSFAAARLSYIEDRAKAS